MELFFEWKEEFLKKERNAPSDLNVKRPQREKCTFLIQMLRLKFLRAEFKLLPSNILQSALVAEVFRGSWQDKQPKEEVDILDLKYYIE